MIQQLLKEKKSEALNLNTKFICLELLISFELMNSNLSFVRQTYLIEKLLALISVKDLYRKQMTIKGKIDELCENEVNAA